MDEGWDDLDLDDWSETEEGDASDTWDDFDDEAAWDDDDAEEFDGDEVEEEWNAWDAGDAVAPAGAPGATEQAPGPTMSALEFGAAAAVAGWLLDQQADRIVGGVRQGVVQPPQSAAWQQLPRPSLRDATPQRLGDLLTTHELAAVVRKRLADGHDLALEATLESSPSPTHPSAASFTVVVTHLVAGRRVWLLFPERTGGFSVSLLQPVFADQGPAGVACCFVDSPEAAVAVVAWALQRYHLTLEQFRWTGGF